MRGHPDVLIVGGGVIGLTTAYLLGRAGASVRVLDRSAPGSEASWAGAGIIPPGNPAGAQSPLDRLRAVSSGMFPRLSADLHEQTGIDNGFRVCGGIECFEEDSRDTIRLWQSEGIAFERLPFGSVRAIEPALRAARGECFLLPGMAQVRNPWHIRALLDACELFAVKVVPHTRVTAFHGSGSKVRAIGTEAGERHVAAKFLIASGAWSDQLLSSLGVLVGVHPVRGQVVLFRTTTRLFQRVICVGKRYLVPREDGRVIVGSTEEPEAGFDKRTTEAGITGLAQWAVSIAPALASDAIERTWAGLRPGTPDGLPFIGPVPGSKNVFVATGHFRAGIQLSPATAEIMADLLTGRPPSVPWDDFRLDRPPALPVATAFRS
jgi:glycine oxidase